jgi:hypothetical protein
MMVSSLLAITVAVLIQKYFNRRQGGGSAVEEFARFEI